MAHLSKQGQTTPLQDRISRRGVLFELFYLISWSEGKPMLTRYIVKWMRSTRTASSRGCYLCAFAWSLACRNWMDRESHLSKTVCVPNWCLHSSSMLSLTDIIISCNIDRLAGRHLSPLLIAHEHELCHWWENTVISVRNIFWSLGSLISLLERLSIQNLCFSLEQSYEAIALRVGINVLWHPSDSAAITLIPYVPSLYFSSRDS